MEEEPSLRPTFTELIVRLKRLRIVVEQAGKRGSLPPQVLGQPVTNRTPARAPEIEGGSMDEREGKRSGKEESFGDGKSDKGAGAQVLIGEGKREGEGEGKEEEDEEKQEWSLLLSSGTQAYGALSQSYTAISQSTKRKRRVSSFGDTLDAEGAATRGHGIN